MAMVRIVPITGHLLVTAHLLPKALAIKRRTDKRREIKQAHLEAKVKTQGPTPTREAGLK
jgi:hypothetical protein